MLDNLDYPWSDWLPDDESSQKTFASLRLWLVLPDYEKPPDIRYLMGKLSAKLSSVGLLCIHIISILRSFCSTISYSTGPIFQG